jgi:hypothetical protein
MEVTTYIERITTAMNPDGTIRGVSVDSMLCIDGVAKQSSQVPASGLDDPIIADTLAALSAKTGEELIALRASTAALTTERDTLEIEAEKVPGLTQQVVTLTAEVARLTALVPAPLGPRQITPREFLNRISDEDKLAIMQSKDPRCMAAMWTLFTTLSVDLDSPLLSELIDALIDAGIEIDNAEREAIFA